MKFFVAIISCLITITTEAQTFHPQVRVEYERVIYVHKQMEAEDNGWFREIRKMFPETAVNSYEFIGDTSRSMYRELNETVVPPSMWYRPEADKNIVYNDYLLGRTITQKPVAEETFLIDDSLQPIRWKLTADTRNIAGYDCRKAIGFVGDTVALFAFYTDEILVHGGPEGVHGLPGLILGVGVPRMHITWFATKVETNGINMAAVKPATKGKKSTRKAMMAELDQAVKGWGKQGSALRLKYVL